MANPTTNTIKNECCGFEHQSEWKTGEIVGATTDCTNCGQLLIFQPYGHTINALKFHEYLHDRSKAHNPENNFHWPRDGKNTGYVEV